MKNEKEERMERRRRKEAIEIKVLEFAGDGRKKKEMEKLSIRGKKSR